MPWFPLGQPFKGVSDDLARSEQPPATLRDARNARAVQPSSGRRMISQRSGLTVHGPRINSVGKVDDIAAVTLDQKNVTYSANTPLDDTAEEWTAEPPNKKSCYQIAVDRSGNVYTVEGNNAIAKFSPSGVHLATIALSVKDEGHVVRALAVDEVGYVYAGVSECVRTAADAQASIICGDEEEALLFCFVPFLDEKYEELWSIKPGGFVGDLAVRDGKLYAAINQPSLNKTRLKTWLAIRSAGPIEDLNNEWLPFPTNRIAVNSSGDVFAVSPPNSTRGDNPQNPDLGKSVVAWTPENLPNDVIHYATYDATDVESLTTLGGDDADPEDGDEVITLRDTSGNGRHLTYSPPTNVFDSTNDESRPLWYKEGLAAGGEVVFDRNGREALRAPANLTSTYRHRKRGNPFVPGYIDPDDGEALTDFPDEQSAGFFLFLLCRPVGNTEADGDNRPAPLISWRKFHPAAGAASFTHAHISLVLERDMDSASYGGLANFNEGRMSLWFDTNATPGSDPFGGAVEGGLVTVSGLIPDWAWGNDLDVGLLTLCVVPTGTVGAGVPLGCTVWWNGELKGHFWLTSHYIDSTGGAALATDWETGRTTAAGGKYGYGSMGFTEMRVYDRKDPANGGTATGDDPLTRPAFPELPESPDPTDPGYYASRCEILAQGATYTNGTHALSFAVGGGTVEVSPAAGTLTVSGGKAVSTAITDAGEYTGTSITVTAPGAGAGDGNLSITLNLDVKNRTPTQQEEVEGFLMHKHGVQSLLPSLTTSQVMGNKWGGTYELRRAHPFRDEPPTTAATEHNATMATSTEGLLVKLSAGSLAVDWVVEDSVACGYGLALDSSGDVYICGPDTSAANVLKIRKYTDDGDAATLSATATIPNSVVSENVYMGLAVDAFDNIYVPIAAEDQEAAAAMVQIYDSSLSLLDTYADTVDAQNQQAFACGLPTKWDEGSLVPDNPDYEGEVELTEFLYVAAAKYDAQDPAVDQQRELVKVKLVDTVADGSSPRLLWTIAASNGRLRGFDGSVAWNIRGTGGEDFVFSATATTGARYIDHAVLNEEIYFCDGGPRYIVYSPNEDTAGPPFAGSQQNASSYLAPTKGGKLPAGARLIAAWQGRLVLARFQDSPQNWWMSAQDDPRDWRDYQPGLPPGQAVHGTLVEGPGLVPDIINGLVPWNDDLLIFLCDHSIYRMTGNPLDGGVIDLVSSVTGGAFGRAWCKDNLERVWFLGSRGGLYLIDPRRASVPEWVSEMAIERRLQDIDFSTYYPELVYNAEDTTVHIYFMPYDDDQAAVVHYVFDAKTGHGGFWPDSYANPSGGDAGGSQPTATLLVDGDDVDDRKLLIGTNDGFIKRWDRTSKVDASDLGTEAPIDFYADMGPYVAPQEDRELRVTRAQIVLPEDVDGGRLECYATDTPEKLGAAKVSRPLAPGRNFMPLRARGRYIWLRIRNSAPGQTCAIEYGSIKAHVAGKTQARVSRG